MEILNVQIKIRFHFENENGNGENGFYFSIQIERDEKKHTLRCTKYIDEGEAEKK